MTVPHFIRSTECKEMLAMPVMKRDSHKMAEAWRCEWRLKATEWDEMASENRRLIGVVEQAERNALSCEAQAQHCRHLAAA